MPDAFDNLMLHWWMSFTQMQEGLDLRLLQDMRTSTLVRVWRNLVKVKMDAGMICVTMQEVMIKC